MKFSLVWLTLFTRVMVGLLFGMVGFHKVFVQGPEAHTSQFFTGPYAGSWMPHWLLYATGVTIPFVEVIAGWLLVIGFLRLPAALALGGVLLLVTYGHARKEPLFHVNSHIIPRTLLLIPTWVLSLESDPWSQDAVIARWRSK